MDKLEKKGAAATEVEELEPVAIDEVHRALVQKGVHPDVVKKMSEETARAKHADLLENPPPPKPFVWMVNKDGKRVTALEEDALAMKEHCEHHFDNPADEARLKGLATDAGNSSLRGGGSAFSENAEQGSDSTSERHSARKAAAKKED